MKKILLIVLLCFTRSAMADNVSAQASSVSQGSASSSISHGGIGYGGSASSVSNGGSGYGGEGGEGGIGYGGMGGTGGLGMGGNGGNGTGGAANNAGNSQSFSIDTPRQSPAVFMAAPPPTAVCQASLGGFLSFIGGIGLAGSRTLEECEMRESARLAHSIGQNQIALEIMCMTKYGSRTSVCRNDEDGWMTE